MRIALAVSLLLAAVIPVNNTQQRRELGAFYFDALDQSQVWMNLEPEPMESGPRPVTLNFTVAFPGRRLTSTPDVVTVRAQSNANAFPLRIREPILRFTTAAGRLYDLTSPGRTYNFTAGCETCPLDTLTTKMAFDELRELAASPHVSGDALGFAVTLAPADLAAIQRLIDAVDDGAVVK